MPMFNDEEEKDRQLNKRSKIFFLF